MYIFPIDSSSDTALSSLEYKTLQKSNLFLKRFKEMLRYFNICIADPFVLLLYCGIEMYLLLKFLFILLYGLENIYNLQSLLRKINKF